MNTAGHGGAKVLLIMASDYCQEGKTLGGSEMHNWSRLLDPGSDLRQPAKIGYQRGSIYNLLAIARSTFQLHTYNHDGILPVASRPLPASLYAETSKVRLSYSHSGGASWGSCCLALQGCSLQLQTQQRAVRCEMAYKRPSKTHTHSSTFLHPIMRPSIPWP